MKGLTFILSVALWLVFLDLLSSYGVTPTEQPYRWRRWLKTTAPPYSATPTPLPYWRNPYYFRQITPTPLPYWRNPYNFTPTEQPYRWRRWWVTTSSSYGVTPTPLPYWKNPYYFRTTEQPYRRRNWWETTYDITPTPLPYWRNFRPISSYRASPTPLPYWRNPYYVRPTSSSYGVTPTPLPYWRNPYYFRTTKQPYRRRNWWETTYDITPTPLPYWRNPYYFRPTEQPYRRRNWWESTYDITPTPLPYWRNPYYFRPTEQPYRRRNWWETTYDITPTPLPYWRNPYYFRPTPLPYWKNPYYFRPTPQTYMTTSAPSWRRPFYPRPYAPDPSVEVYQKVESSESLIVVCQFGTKTSVSSFHLSVRNGDGNYMLKDPACIAETMCAFNVTVTPPVSFTCVHVVNARRDIQTLLSDIYVYQPPNVSEHLEPQASPSYIGFASFIGVGLVFLVTMVVATTLITRHKGSRREVKENVYTITEII